MTEIDRIYVLHVQYIYVVKGMVAFTPEARFMFFFFNSVNDMNSILVYLYSNT